MYGMLIKYLAISWVQGQLQFAQTIKRYNSMQELRGASDTTDFNKSATWYGSVPDDPNYNPENDVDILKQQYKPSQATSKFIEEEPSFETNELQHSQSEL